MTRGFKTLGRSCNCEENVCLVFSDDFNRLVDEEIFGIDSTGHWKLVEPFTWEIFDGELSTTYIIDPGVDPEIVLFDAEIPGLYPVPRQFSLDLLIRMPENGKARVKYTASKGSETRVYALEIEATGLPCGYARLLDMSAGETEIKEVPVFGLGPGESSTLIKICYSAEQQIMSAIVTASITDSVTLHKTSLETPTNDLDVSAISLQTVGERTGMYRVAFFKLAQTRTLEDGAYGLADDCPSCNNRRLCWGVTDNFDDEELECSWVQEAGEWTEADDRVTTRDADAVLAWIRSSLGIDADGQVDPTVVVSTTFESTGFENSIVVYVDKEEGAASGHYAKVKIRSDAEDDGTLGIYDSESGEAIELLEIPGLDRNTAIGLKVCWDGEKLTAQIGEDAVSAFVEAYGGTQVALGTQGTVLNEVRFFAFSISNAMYDQHCDDCIDPDEPAACEMAKDGEIAPAVRVMMRGLRSYLEVPDLWPFPDPITFECDPCKWFRNKWFVIKTGPVVDHECAGSAFGWADFCSHIEEPIIGNEAVDCICSWASVFEPASIAYNPDASSPAGCRYHSPPAKSFEVTRGYLIQVQVVKRGLDLFINAVVSPPSHVSGTTLFFQKLWKTLEEEDDPVPLNPPEFGSLKVPLVCVGFNPFFPESETTSRGACVWATNEELQEDEAPDVYLFLSDVE